MNVIGKNEFSLLSDMKKQLSLKRSNLFSYNRPGNVALLVCYSVSIFLCGVTDDQNGFQEKFWEICLTLGAKKWVLSVPENFQILSESSSILSE